MHPLREHIRRSLALFALVWAVAAAVAQEPAAPSPLTNCAAVKSLPRDAAAQKLPVRIKGVVSYREALGHSSNSSFVLHDGVEGVYCTLSPDINKSIADLQVGEKLEIVGVSGPGFTPVVEVSSMKHLGPGTLPPSSPSKLWKLQNGRYDCALISLEGVVRRMHKDGLGSYRLELAEETGTFSAFVPAQEGELPESLLDTRLRLEGTCFTLFNPRGECTGINIRLTSPKDLAVMQRGRVVESCSATSSQSSPVRC